MGAVTLIQHHHRSTTKTEQKSFKSKHATKSALKDRAKGKIEREDRGKRRTPHQQVMSKLERRNRAKQLRLNNKERQDHESSIFQGPNAAAKHIAIVPLSDDIDVINTIQRLSKSVEIEVPMEKNGPIPVAVDRFKRNLLFLPTTTDLVSALDVCKMADWILFLIRLDQEFGEMQDTLLRGLEGQGITTVTAMVTNIEENIPANKRSKHTHELKTAFSRYFAGIEKISVLENQSDCANLMRSFCTAAPKGIRWRDDRSWLLVDSVDWRPGTDGTSTVIPIITGTIRGRGLNPDRLVHVQGWGEFKIKRVCEVRPQVHKRKANEMTIEEDARQWLPTVGQDELAELAPEEPQTQDTDSIGDKSEHKGVLLDDHHYFSDDNSHIPTQPKKLPKGTSSYQAAWYLDDVSDSDSDVLDDETEVDGMMDDLALGPEDGAVVNHDDVMTQGGATEYPESEMHVDASEEEESRQLEEFRASRKLQAEEDLEFPDEIELHPNVLARERLAKYRGLKNLRTSDWNAEEDKAHEPQEYRRLLQIPEYKKSYNSAIKDTLVGGVPTGTKVEIELEGVPVALRGRRKPLSLFALLRHEHKHAVVNLNLTLSSQINDPIKSKEELVVQIAHRRFAINPIFSAAGQTPNDVHKFDRFLHPGRSAIATFTGPLTWGSVPVLVFRRTKKHANGTPDDTTTVPDLINSSSPELSQLELIGTATTVPPSSSRVVAKRVILTGHPFKIHKKLVTIRYMFFNREDVSWFSALPLWTKRGRQGFIKEPLGTHGYFKATFDGVSKVNAMDAVGVSLYKRVWPRPCRRLD